MKKIIFKLMTTNISFIIFIALLLILGGWSFKALISLAQGKPIEINFKNPLNLKARWPRENKNK